MLCCCVVSGTRWRVGSLLLVVKHRQQRVTFIIRIYDINIYDMNIYDMSQLDFNLLNNPLPALLLG